MCRPISSGAAVHSLEDLKRFGCTEDDLRRASSPTRPAAAGVSGRSRQAVLSEGRAALPKHDERRLVAARIMGAIYFDLLRTIERSGYDVFRRGSACPVLGRR